MTDTATPTREWLDGGTALNEKAARDNYWGKDKAWFDDQVEKAAASLTWHDVPEDGVIHGPMSPVLMLQACIEQLDLRPVVAYAYSGDPLEYPDGPESATYSLVGVEVKTSKQRFRLFILDMGVGATPMLVDWYPAPQ